MAVIKAIELRKGRVIVHEGQLWTVFDAKHVWQQQRSALMRAKLKNLQSGQIIDVRFAPEDTIEVPFLESREYEYLYDEGDDIVLMDLETYDQVHAPKELLGDQIQFLKPNERLTCQIHEGNIISMELPNVVELKIVETPPVVKGATVTNQPKDAILETGVRIRVPSFLEPGEVVRVDTRTGEYVERAK